jgi:hypothetical protein
VTNLAGGAVPVTIYVIQDPNGAPSIAVPAPVKLPVTITSGTPGVGTVTSPVNFGAGTTFTPVSVGTTKLTINLPSGFVHTAYDTMNAKVQ